MNFDCDWLETLFHLIFIEIETLFAMKIICTVQFPLNEYYTGIRSRSNYNLLQRSLRISSLEGP